MTISGKTNVYGILACPVEHSMSPVLQNLYGEMSGADMVYVPFRTEPEGLSEAVRGAYALNVRGMNVTVPHKEAVIPYLKDMDENAAAVGAVNTLVRVDGGYKGYNTDVPGIWRAMKEEGIAVDGVPCILFGAGGAAKAAGYVLAKNGARVVYLINRNEQKAAALAEYINKVTGRDAVKPVALADYKSVPKDSYLAVQTTSLGMSPHADAAPVEDREFYSMIHTGFDAVYNPAETKFMKYVRECGGKAYNGLGMLLYQGIVSFELWNPGVIVGPEAVVAAKAKVMELLRG